MYRHKNYTFLPMQLIYTAQGVLYTGHPSQLRACLSNSSSYRSTELVVDELEVWSLKTSYECASLPWGKNMLLYLQKFYTP